LIFSQKENFFINLICIHISSITRQKEHHVRYLKTIVFIFRKFGNWLLVFILKYSFFLSLFYKLEKKRKWRAKTISKDVLFRLLDDIRTRIYILIVSVDYILYKNMCGL